MNKAATAFLLPITLLTFIGCGSSDPLTSFKRKLDSATTAAQSAALVQVDGQWQKVRFKIVDLKYDVKHTDSLASPYTAKVAFKASEGLTTLRNEKSAARSDPDPKMPDTTLQDGYYATYAFQDGAWKLTDFTFDLLLGGNPKTPSASQPEKQLLQSYFQ